MKTRTNAAAFCPTWGKIARMVSLYDGRGTEGKRGVRDAGDFTAAAAPGILGPDSAWMRRTLGPPGGGR